MPGPGLWVQENPMYWSPSPLPPETGKRKKLGEEIGKKVNFLALGPLPPRKNSGYGLGTQHTQLHTGDPQKISNKQFFLISYRDQ